MAMSAGGASGGPRSDINVTPLVDVVLVLLIIFMVITPLLQMGLPVLVPPKVETPSAAPKDQLVIRMTADGGLFLNSEQVALSNFGSRLEQMIAYADPEVVFFAADGELLYEQVTEVMDMCKDHGVKNLGIVFDDLAARR
jgi:biopolymer transport protein TolR